MGAAGAVRERDGGGQENGVQPTGDLLFFFFVNKSVRLGLISDSSVL